MSAATVSKSIYATLSPTEILTGQEKILDSHTEKSSTDIVLYSQIYEIEGDYDKAATVILDYLKDNDSGTAVRMYNRLKHLKTTLFI